MTRTISRERVLVGMSGGVDSSAACMLLQEQGYEVVGITMRMWDTRAQFTKDGQTEPSHVLEARSLAEKLGIEHHTLDVREAFRQEVVQNFIDEYLQGRTPNPCVLCNLRFKWKYLLSEADRLHCDKVATGHYARIETDENGTFYIVCGADGKKDQSYFLWRLGQTELSRTLFPLGGMTKEAIKKFVQERGFVEKAQKKESMEVCFVENDYRDFLKENLPDFDLRVQEGYYVDNTGKRLGMHKGYPLYTIGQRKGLNIAMGYPVFVTKINPDKNTVKLGRREELDCLAMIVEDFRASNIDKLLSANPLDIRIRYRSAGQTGRVEMVDDSHLIVRFDQPASAVTPGQSAVFYQDGKVLGGGIIASYNEWKKYL
ncbi:MAG: tRNA 2-thiouridine(34) synthase MnmA [Bacteroidaceae bacterium]|nr:tRNA 2-thiouridine(34) synthase MnmA [Bacteroidaceae bacterium]